MNGTPPPGPPYGPINPATVYHLDQVTRLLGVTRRQLMKLRHKSQVRLPEGLFLPLPFMLGKTPHWMGHVLKRWLENLTPAERALLVKIGRRGAVGKADPEAGRGLIGDERTGS